MKAIMRDVGAVFCYAFGLAAGFVYVQLFYDEFDRFHPANAGGGFLPPMYRHWIELIIIVWSTFFALVVGYYSLVGAKLGLIVKWPTVRRYLFRLHVISGTVILLGLLNAVIIGQPMSLRDTVTMGLGLSLFAVGVWDQTAFLRARKSTS